MDPQIQEHSLTPQGRIYKTAVATDENLQYVGPEFRGTGATPQQKEDDSRSWISHDKDTNVVVEDDDGSSMGRRPQPDVIAQALYKKIPGPLNAAMAKLEDGLESVGGTNFRGSKSAGGFSQHLHVAALDKMNALKSSFAANAPSKQAAEGSPTAMEDTKQRRTAEAGAKGQHDPITVEEKANAESK